MAIDELVNLSELLHAGVGVRVHAGDELELRLAEVGRDMRMRQRRAERERMRSRRKPAVRRDAQAFFLDAAHESAQCVHRQCRQPGV